MALFRLLLITLWIVIAVYTAITIANHGLNLLPIFFGDMATMAWPGQFNLDFFCMLILSALWTCWRHNFSPAGIGLGLLAFFGGASFLSIYLFILSFQTKGDVAAILLGNRRPDRA